MSLRRVLSPGRPALCNAPPAQLHWAVLPRSQNCLAKQWKRQTVQGDFAGLQTYLPSPGGNLNNYTRQTGLLSWKLSGRVIRLAAKLEGMHLPALLEVTDLLFLIYFYCFLCKLLGTSKHKPVLPFQLSSHYSQLTPLANKVNSQSTYESLNSPKVITV